MGGGTIKAVMIGLLLSTAGCASMRKALDERSGNFTGNLPDIDDRDAAEFAQRQNNLWNCFVSLAQAKAASFKRTAPNEYSCPDGDAAPNFVKSELPGATKADAAVPQVDASAAQLLRLNVSNELADGSRTPVPAYSEVVAAGIHYVDVRCDRFMDALFWFNRIRETGSRQVQFISAASSAALTILEASKTLIGLAPLGITLVDQTINNIGRGLLYDLPPHTVRGLVEKQQRAYLQGVAKEYTSRPHAMRTIQGYAALCLPATIEAEVNRAVQASEFKPIDWEKPKALVRDPAADQDSDAGQPATEPKKDRVPGTPPPNHVPAVTQDDG